MTSGVKLEPIANLLSKEFFIRSYQRGYRWEKGQVTDLLNDFQEFIDLPGKSEEEFYCLQPIVVKKLSPGDWADPTRFNFTNESVYEVIDGQQRLTTITILLHFLTHELRDLVKIPSFPTISYEVRDKSREILSNFAYYMTSEEGVELQDNIDFYHMKLIYNAIGTWFEDNQDYLMPFLKLLAAFRINCVKVIWYEVETAENSIEVFRRFNIGKIPLSNAELIKALFLRNESNADDALRYSISKEWQQIENQLQSPFFWSFLRPGREYTSRIEYLFELMYRGARKNSNKEEKIVFDRKYGTDSQNIFRYFYNLIGNMEHLTPAWDMVNEIFEKMVQWYNSPEHYHYIGYLQNMELKNKNDDFVLDILTYRNPKTHKPFETKKELSDYLIAVIRDKSATCFKGKKIALTYADPAVKLRDFFFLFNIETYVHLSQSSNGEEIYRLPFNLYKKMGYDIEHIDSKTEKSPEELSHQQKTEYLKDLQADFEAEIGESFRESIRQLFRDSSIPDPWPPENVIVENLSPVLEDCLELVDRLFEKDPDRFEDKNVIGNLALLNGSINRSYGNSYFSTKRRLIIENDKKGVFIPIATKNIFLKYYSGEVRKHTRWSISDAAYYTLQIEETLNKFMQ